MIDHHSYEHNLSSCEIKNNNNLFKLTTNITLIMLN